MPQPGFYNQNLYRDYPFQSQSAPLERIEFLSEESSASSDAYSDVALPHATAVDFGCFMNTQSNFADGQDWIYLYRVIRSGPFFVFEFRTTANDHSLVFTRRLSDTEFEYEWSQSQSPDVDIRIPELQSLSSSSSASSASAAPFEDDCTTTPLWEGFLITGRLDELAELIPYDGSLYFNPGYQVIEPARIQNLDDAFVNSVNLANRARTRSFPPTRCQTLYDSLGSSIGTLDSTQDTSIYLNSWCMRGALTFVEGYNCKIRQENASGTIVIGAGVGRGAGVICEEYPFYPEEVSEPGTNYYTDGAMCQEIYKTISGQGGSRVRLAGGRGFNVWVDGENTIIVDMTLQDFMICPPTETSESA